MRGACAWSCVFREGARPAAAARRRICGASYPCETLAVRMRAPASGAAGAMVGGCSPATRSTTADARLRSLRLRGSVTFAPAAACPWFLDQSRWNSTISEGNLSPPMGARPRAQPPRGLAAAAIRGRRGRRASGNVSARAVAGAPSCLPLPQGASHTAQQQRHKSTGSACAAPRQLAAARARPRP